MSRENVELVRKAFGARGLQETAESYWHPQVEYVEDPRWPGASTYMGSSAASRTTWRPWAARRTWRSRSSVSSTLESAKWRSSVFKARASTSGVPHEHLWGYVVEVREERIVYFRAYYEPAEALEAVGLRE